MLEEREDERCLGGRPVQVRGKGREGLLTRRFILEEKEEARYGRST